MTMTVARRQLAFFEDTNVDLQFGENITKYGYRLREVDIGDITFQAGQNESVHRWYRLTPSFSPGLVRYFLSAFKADTSSLVLDPFSGRGTTVIECQKHGVPCVAYEINPTLREVGNLSLRWKKKRSELLLQFTERLAKDIQKMRSLEFEAVLEATGSAIPDIHDVFRWWKKNVLRDLLIARQLMRQSEYKVIRDYLWLAVNTAALDCANIHRNHPTITFHDDHKRDINVLGAVRMELEKIESDLTSLTSDQIQFSELGKVELRNSCEPLAANRRCPKFTHVITSPPYPNRFSYIHQTRPQLHFMELIHDRGDATEIDLKTIGGTWGRATSILMKSLIKPPDDMREALDYYDELSSKSVLMCNYATKYFLALNAHIAELKKAVTRGFQGAYVVGNSRLSGVEIFTEVILGRLFELNGFKVDEILLFRKRGGRKRLYETAVCIRV